MFQKKIPLPGAIYEESTTDFQQKVIASWCFFATHLKNTRKSNWIEFPQIGISNETNTSNHNPNCVCLKERFQVNLGINQMYPKYPNPSKLAIFWGPKHPCYTGSFTLPLMHHGIYFFSPNVWANLLLELADGFRGCIYYKIYVASKRNRHHHHQTLIWAQRTFQDRYIVCFVYVLCSFSRTRWMCRGIESLIGIHMWIISISLRGISYY